MEAVIDRKTYALAVITALLLLAAGAWPARHTTRAFHDGQPGYFWRSSSLDAAISPADADAQTSRVARERHLSEPRVTTLIPPSTRNDIYNITAEPRVDVAELNTRLDAAK